MMPVASVCPSKMTYSCGTVADLHRFPFLIILGNEPIAIANLHKNIGFHACSVKKVHPDLPLPNMKLIVPGYSQGFKPMPR